MGQKVNPTGFRLGFIRDWDARWYADKNYAELLHEDLMLRRYLEKRLDGASVTRIEIERAANNIKLNIHTAKPGIVIGKGGTGVERLRKNLEELTGKKVYINIMEVRTPEINALLVAENIASQLARRVSFRRAMKQSISRAMRSGAKGVKVACSGRLGGAEMARNEVYHEGTVPLQTLRADIDYGFVESHTTYGRIGVKVWIHKGEIIPKKRNSEANPTKEESLKKEESLTENPNVKNGGQR